MTIQYVNTGSSPNKGDGDSLRTAFGKINSNFTTLQSAMGEVSSIITSATAPTSSTQGLLWYDTIGGRSYIFYDNNWVDASPYAVTSTGTANFGYVDSDIVPSIDLTYNLGSPSRQWSSLYVGTSTIYLGGSALSVSGGNLTIDGSPVSGSAGATIGDRLTSSTYSVILEGTTGTISVPNAIISQSYQLELAGSQNSYDIGRYLRVRDGDIETHLHLDTPNNNLYDIILGDDSKFVRVDHTGTVVIGTVNFLGSPTTYNTWTFSVNGDLALPDNGGIVFDRADTSIRVGMGFHIASGEGIVIDAIDQTAVLTLSGAGNGPVNQTYNKTNGTFYTGNTFNFVIVVNLGGTWNVLIDGDSKYTSNDLLGWALSTGPGPAPTGVLSNGYKSWGFGSDGLLTLPSGNTTIGNPLGSDAIISAPDTSFGVLSQGSTGFSSLQWFDTIVEPLNIAGIVVNSPYAASTGSVQIYTGIVGPTPQNAWTFDPAGGLTFPDTTVQTTAYTGMVWSISASGTSDYVFSGPGIESGNTNDPVLYLYRGFTYTFVNTTGGSHPFAIRVSNGGADYTRGVSGSQTATQTFTVPMDAPSTLYYQCTFHSGMGNTINIV